MNLSWRRIRAIALKEYKHIVRDTFTLLLALGMPIGLVLFFGFAIELDYKEVPLLIRDNDNSSVSRLFVSTMSNSEYFKVRMLDSQRSAEDAVRKNDTSALLIINKNFGRDIKSGKQAEVQLLLDGADNSKSSAVSGYLSGFINSAEKTLASENNEEYLPGALAANMRTRFLFNPELVSSWFTVPGLCTVIIGLLAIVMTALTVAKEWENGSMELLLSTPIRPVEMVLGKIIPYFLLSIFSVFLIFVIAVLVFGIPFRGSFILYILGSCIYTFACLCLGIFISVKTRNQQAATQIGFAVGLLPGVLLSGFFFAIKNMSPFFQAFTAALPQRWFMELSRTLYLTEAGFKAVTAPFAGITLFSACALVLVLLTYKKDVEP
ncbi:ABC-2 type transport system permease protein [Parelusimicrobium proximum]|uniref:ABC transporter permease n=1 Tax=Parelusimicrobium proximum TaxID=3228953 RepID=UPI003D1729E7